ncbi:MULTISPECIES: BON domain-containing protein [Vogesella]|jgi:osmotically-inducible protein OsmY|uniref:BON domain-containing protein n=1 Tax=Vogesella indigofera TaxID=45465 RepID=A0A495BK10_VOGIN|nr:MULTISPECIES: BON domain-containing protein [Vogesella]MCQ4143135.1 BON domain-containing protein [Vogesella sp. AC12]MDC7690348.1 BON domain-containing protein [Vogesella indigofera]RKQ61448.1 BON domain-containing protein [Vogesella indigofera]
MKALNKYLSAFFVVASLMSVAACSATREHQSTGQYMDDSVITGRVKTAIFNDPVLKVTEINVETYMGRVQLSGFVRSDADADRAVQLTRGISGVKSVKDDMQVK